MGNTDPTRRGDDAPSDAHALGRASASAGVPRETLPVSPGGLGAGAIDQFMPMLYAELRRIAEVQLSGERKGHTLQPTALVNEAYIRLSGQRNVALMDNNQFLAAASLTIRRILVDYAKTRNRAKRGGGASRVNLEPEELGVDVEDVDHLAIDDALAKLAKESPRAAQLVELRFYGGCSVEQVAEVLGISERTVANEWRFAKAWLLSELGANPTTPQ